MIQSDSENEETKKYQIVNHQDQDMNKDIQQYNSLISSLFKRVNNQNKHIYQQYSNKSKQSLINLIQQYNELFKLSEHIPYDMQFEELIFSKRSQQNELGKGGSAKVIKVRNLISDQICAIKVIKYESEQEMEVCQEFIIQEKLQQINKESFLNFKKPVILNPKWFYLVAELEIAEYSLQNYILKNTISYSEYEQIAIQLIQGFYILHTNKFAHRDIKPYNILYVKNKWVYSDFGVTLQYKQTHGYYQIVGTEKYLPQRIQQLLHLGQSNSDLDLYQCDKYALQITLSQILNQNQKISNIQKIIKNKQYTDKYITLLDNDLEQIKIYFQQQQQQQQIIIYKQLENQELLNIKKSVLKDKDYLFIKAFYFQNLSSSKKKEWINILKNSILQGTEEYEKLQLFLLYLDKKYQFINFNNYLNYNLSDMFYDFIFNLLQRFDLILYQISFQNKFKQKKLKYTKIYNFQQNQEEKKHQKFNDIKQKVRTMDENKLLKKCQINQILERFEIRYKYLTFYNCIEYDISKEKLEPNKYFKQQLTLDFVANFKILRKIVFLYYAIPKLNTCNYIYSKLYLANCFQVLGNIFQSTLFFNEQLFTLLVKIPVEQMDQFFLQLDLYLIKLYQLNKNNYFNLIKEFQQFFQIGQQTQTQQLLIFYLNIKQYQYNLNQLVQFLDNIETNIYLTPFISTIINQIFSLQINVTSSDLMFQKSQQLLIIQQFEQYFQFYQFFQKHYTQQNIVHLLTTNNQNKLRHQLKYVVIAFQIITIQHQTFFQKINEIILSKNVKSGLKLIFYSLIQIFPLRISTTLLFNIGYQWYKLMEFNDQLFLYYKPHIKELVHWFNKFSNSYQFNQHLRLQYLLIEAEMNLNQDIKKQFILYKKIQNVLLQLQLQVKTKNSNLQNKINIANQIISFTYFVYQEYKNKAGNVLNGDWSGNFKDKMKQYIQINSKRRFIYKFQNKFVFQNSINLRHFSEIVLNFILDLFKSVLIYSDFQRQEEYLINQFVQLAQQAKQ